MIILRVYLIFIIKVHQHIINNKIGIGHALNSYLEIFSNEDDNWINLKETIARDKISGINAPKLPKAVMIEVDLDFTKDSSLHTYKHKSIRTKICA